MGFNAYIGYLNSIGLERTGKYDYLDKERNVMRETERMINRSLMMFEWHGLPKTIPQRQLELILQCQGYAIIGKINDELYACYGGLGGNLDEYYRPTKAIVSIPYFNFNAIWDIGKECIIIRNDTMMQGLLPLYAKYDTLIDETEISLLLATVNQRIETIISASDNPTIESARQYLKDVMAGKQGVIADNAFISSLSLSARNQNSGQIRELLESLQYLKASLYNEIGLATNYNLKKERVTQAEIELNTDNLYPLVDDMYFCRMQGIEEIKELFGNAFEVELNSSWDYRTDNGEPMTTKGDSANDATTSTQGGLQSTQGVNASESTAKEENAVTIQNNGNSGQDEKAQENDSVDGVDADNSDNSDSNGNEADRADSDDDNGGNDLDNGSSDSNQDDVGDKEKDENNA